MRDHNQTTDGKRPLLLEDLRNHSAEQLAELRLVLAPVLHSSRSAKARSFSP